MKKIDPLVSAKLSAQYTGEKIIHRFFLNIKMLENRKEKTALGRALEKRVAGHDDLLKTSSNTSRLTTELCRESHGFLYSTPKSISSRFENSSVDTISDNSESTDNFAAISLFSNRKSNSPVHPVFRKNMGAKVQ